MPAPLPHFEPPGGERMPPPAGGFGGQAASAATSPTPADAGSLAWLVLSGTPPARGLPPRRPTPRTAADAPVWSNDAGGWSKRLLDIVVAGSALVLLAPLILLAAGLIWLTMGRPIIYGHRRVGRHGRPFTCYKLRTMHSDGDRILREYLERNPDARAEWDSTRKLMDDPRVTPLGHVLRKASIDELPQLFNVLLGDMSCVGPRPIVEAEMERYGEGLGAYLSVRPGLTGLWQVAGRNRLGYDERVSLDVTYVRSRTLLLDLAILVRTVPVVLKFENTA